MMAQLLMFAVISFTVIHYVAFEEVFRKQMGKQVDHSGTSFQPTRHPSPLNFCLSIPVTSLWNKAPVKKNQLLANCLLKLEPNFLQVCSFLFSPQFPHSFAKWLLRVLYNVKNFEIWPVNFLFLSCSRSTIQEDWAKALIL